MQQEKTDKQTRELVNEFRSSPLAFVREMWGLTPQPLKPEYADVTQNAPLTAFKAKWFDPFVKGKHITWQQWLIFRAVEDAIQGRAQRHISVKTGHGIGKTAAFAMLIIWFLFCWEDAQAPITAPTSDQLHDVLWKELKIWLDKMPKKISELYDHTTGYLRIKEREKTWFARARTARKENPEAFAGVHGEHVFVGADEASGVPEEVYKTAEGILTNENVLVLLISNPTRLVGYFHNTFKGDKHNWQVLEFSSEDSPIVEDDYCERMSQKYGKDSDEYRVRVLGRFPKEDAVDEKGYVPLLTREMLRFIPDQPFDKSNMRLGLDVAGEGSDKLFGCSGMDSKRR